MNLRLAVHDCWNKLKLSQRWSVTVIQLSSKVLTCVKKHEQINLRSWNENGIIIFDGGVQVLGPKIYDISIVRFDD